MHRIAEAEGVVVRPVRERNLGRIHHVDIEMHRDPTGAAWRDRGFGDLWGYAVVAEGVGEVMFEPELYSWDLAAPLIVVEEAGGRLTDFTGRRTYEGGNAVVTNGCSMPRSSKS